MRAFGWLARAPRAPLSPLPLFRRPGDVVPITFNVTNTYNSVSPLARAPPIR